MFAVILQLSDLVGSKKLYFYAYKLPNFQDIVQLYFDQFYIIIGWK